MGNRGSKAGKSVKEQRAYGDTQNEMSKMCSRSLWKRGANLILVIFLR